MKYSIYVLSSFVLATLVLVRSFYLRPNFWSAAILLSQSNGSLLVLTNLGLIFTGGTVYLLQRLFYGRLRAIEIEQLYEKGWVAVTETALALTIFREDVGTRFFIMFLSLMVGKIWAWIGEGRIEFMEQQPSASKWPTMRLAASLFVSLVFDVLLLRYCLATLAREPRPGMWVMYAFEFVILLTQSISLFLRFTLDVSESVIVHRQIQANIQIRRERLRQERESSTHPDQTASASDMDGEIEIDDMDIDVPGWEEKGRWMFYLDLMTDFVKSLVYCGFFMVLLFFHGLPLHIMRDLYITVRSFVKRVTDFMQYRNATRDMNARYPDATATELQGDNTCIVCREEMTAWEEMAVAGEQDHSHRRIDERQRPKKLPCGHILHFGCLRSWLERQRVCPTCRRSVLAPDTPVGHETNLAAGGNGQRDNGPQQDRMNLEGLAPNNHHGQNRADQPANQLRVLNFGPLRVAFGRAHGAAAVQGLVQQIAGRQQQQQQVDPQVPTLSQQISHDPVVAATPAILHQQVMHLQTQALQMMERLTSDHQQLEVLEQLVAELVRLQSREQLANLQDESILAASTSSRPPIQRPMGFRIPSTQHTMGAGHPNLPSGLVLPPGYTLERLHAVDHTITGTSSPSMNGGLPHVESAGDDYLMSSQRSSMLQQASSADEGGSTTANTIEGRSTESDNSIRRRQPQAVTVEDE